MNWDQIEGKWLQMKGAIKQKWGKLTDGDMEMIAGNKDMLIGKIQERYGITKEEAQRQVENFNLPSAGETDVTRERKVS